MPIYALIYLLVLRNDIMQLRRLVPSKETNNFVDTVVLVLPTDLSCFSSTSIRYFPVHYCMIMIIC